MLRTGHSDIQFRQIRSQHQQISVSTLLKKKKRLTLSWLIFYCFIISPVLFFSFSISKYQILSSPKVSPPIFIISRSPPFQLREQKKNTKGISKLLLFFYWSTNNLEFQWLNIGKDRLCLTETFPIQIVLQPIIIQLIKGSMINPGPPYPQLNGQPPAYPNQIIPPPSTVIFINNGNNNDSNATYCRQCKTKTENIPRRKVGRVTIVWSFVLAFIGLPCCLCCIPFCNDDCKDLEVVCMVCDGVKETIQAQCC